MKKEPQVKRKRWRFTLIRCLLTLIILVAMSAFAGGWYYGIKFGTQNLCDEMKYYYPDHLPVRGCGEHPDGSFVKQPEEKHKGNIYDKDK